MAQALVAFANGSEEIETISVVDVLRRAGVSVTLASVEPSLQVRASRAVEIVADSKITDCVNRDWDAIILPGGMPGAEALSACDDLILLLKKQLERQSLVAAICAAPAVCLGRHGLIAEFQATCYPSFQAELATHVADVSTATVVRDRHLITSQGPATAIGFALSIVEALKGEQTSKVLADQLLFSA